MTTLARLIFAFSLFLLPCLTHAQTPLLGPGGWQLAAPHPGDAQIQETAGPTGPVETITISTPAQPFYLEQIIRAIPSAVPAGHLLRMHFEARSATQNPLRVSVEQSVAPYTAALAFSTVLTPQWQAFTLSGTSPGYGPDGLNTHFQVGQQAGVIELRGITLMDTGPDPAVTEANAALTPSAIQARIEKYRKGTLTVHVVGRNGKPIRNASVQITQTRHAFLFGCNAFGYDPADGSPEQLAYRSQFTALFNYATLPFYWGAFEPVRGKPEYARLQAMVDWCMAHEITPKGHPLVWHEVWPDWAPKDPDAAIPLLHARVADIVPHFKNSIHYWDALNEANGAAENVPPNGESEWIKRDGPAPVVETALIWARAAGAGQPETFLYNDYDTTEANVSLLTQLKRDNKLPDVVGLQSHMHSGVWPMTKVWTTCQRFSQFGKPIHFTETTVLSGPKRTVDFNGPYPNDWLTTPADEAAQADYVAQFYTVLFSHPALRAVTWWDLSDRNAWLNAPAGLLRKDMTPKPAYTRLLNLIHKTWWTNVTSTTNTQGSAAKHVFYGQYVITARDKQGHKGTQTVFFPEAAGPLSVTVQIR